MKKKLIQPLKTNGQVLICFVLILPLLLIGILFSVEISLNIIEKKNLEEIANITCRYALKEKNKEKIEQLAYQNEKEIRDIEILREKDKVSVTLTKNKKNILGSNKKKIQVTLSCRKEEE